MVTEAYDIERICGRCRRLVRLDPLEGLVHKLSVGRLLERRGKDVRILSSLIDARTTSGQIGLGMGPPTEDAA
jgi:hypothetical protein